MKNNDIALFLKKNPQLKEIETILCGQLDDNIFQWIAKYVPGIEKFTFGTIYPTKRVNIKFCGHLRELKSLSMNSIGDECYKSVQYVVHEIAAAEVPLEFFKLTHFDLRYQTQQFIEGISNLTKLKILLFEFVKNITASQCIKMCKPLTELSEIKLSAFDFKLTDKVLLESLEYCEKLQKFDCSSIMIRLGAFRPFIDGGTFKKLAKILEQRNENAKFNLILNGCDFSAKIIEAANHL